MRVHVYSMDPLRMLSNKSLHLDLNPQFKVMVLTVGILCFKIEVS